MGAAIDPWTGAWLGSVQRLDDFAVFLVADTGERWREAAGDLARWGQQALPRLEEAVATARRAVAGSSDVASPIWRHLEERLAGWWPPRPPAFQGEGAAWPTAQPAGPGPMPAGTGDMAVGRAAAHREARASAASDTAVDRSGAAGGEVAAPGQGTASGAPGGAEAAEGGEGDGTPLSDPLHLIPDAAQRAAELATQPVAPSQGEEAGRRTPSTAGAAQGEASPAEQDRSAPAAAAEPRPPATRGEADAEGSGDERGGRDRGSGPRRLAASSRDRAEEGWTAAVASWYGPGFYGRPTASGETFTGREMTAAHRTLPFGTVLLVRYPETGRSVQVRINDRGPYVEGRDLDLSEAAAEALGMISAGVARVVYRVVRWGE
ncbi:MAG TPA: septal ring lytic transglycosylase RlpA family protein [Thermaerobacter sp.]